MKHPTLRTVLVAPLLASMALLSPASARAPAACLGHPGAPSKLDYLVLASLADSSGFLAMSACSNSATKHVL